MWNKKPSGKCNNLYWICTCKSHFSLHLFLHPIFVHLTLHLFSFLPTSFSAHYLLHLFLLIICYIFFCSLFAALFLFIFCCSLFVNFHFTLFCSFFYALVCSFLVTRCLIQDRLCFTHFHTLMEK